MSIWRPLWQIIHIHDLIGAIGVSSDVLALLQWWLKSMFLTFFYYIFVRVCFCLFVCLFVLLLFFVWLVLGFLFLFVFCFVFVFGVLFVFCCCFCLFLGGGGAWQLTIYDLTLIIWGRLKNVLWTRRAPKIQTVYVRQFLCNIKGLTEWHMMTISRQLN